MGSAELSGREWWRSNQGKFPNGRDLADLEPTFGGGPEDAAWVGQLVALRRRAGVGASSPRAMSA
jgi:hypothetical protein